MRNHDDERQAREALMDSTPEERVWALGWLSTETPELVWRALNAARFTEGIDHKRYKRHGEGMEQ